MSILRSNVIACVPDTDCLTHEFVESNQIEELVPIFDKNGKKIRDLRQSRIDRTPIPRDVWTNKGIDADMTSMRTQIESKVQLHPFNGSFIGVDLDESDKLGTDFISQVNKFMDSSKEPLTSNKE